MHYKEQLSNNNLKTVRKSYGLRQQDVAFILDHQITDRISRWEKGTATPSLVNLLKLSSIYGVRPDELYPGLTEQIKKEIKERVKAKDQPLSS
jgi:transcriptional regulator with XRE-family HTH domain